MGAEQSWRREPLEQSRDGLVEGHCILFYRETPNLAHKIHAPRFNHPFQEFDSKTLNMVAGIHQRNLQV